MFLKGNTEDYKYANPPKINLKILYMSIENNKIFHGNFKLTIISSEKQVIDFWIKVV